MDFYDLDLNDNILDALDDMNFTSCTPIQEHAIPPILERRDIIGVAQTGTGKTAAYLLPVLSLLDDGGFPEDAVNCVIMSPTRELAQQIDQAMQGFAYYTPGLSSLAVYGGNDGIRYEQEKRSFKTGANIIIATPGRLISHLSLDNLDLSRVSFFILDEADRMLDMGFCDDIMTIARQLPEDHQTIMFSATMPDEIIKLAKNILHDPVQVKLAVSKPADGIHQSAFVCYEPQKLKLLDHIFTQNEPKRVIIFAGSKLKVKDINISLRRKGYNCEAMHSDLMQQQRDEVMRNFKSGQVDILIATDIVSRGIDIDDIRMVINYDVPHDAEDYVHRIGRTARAGAEGQAITLISEKDQPAFRQIERFLEKDVTKEEMPEALGEAPAYTGKSGKAKSNSRKSGAGNGRAKSKKQAKQETGKRAPKGATTKGKNETPETQEKVNPQTVQNQKKRNNRRRKHSKKTSLNVGENENIV
ncbi:MAG: DEAD/DEAH box helicase [Bacteroidales bacterium]|nr:DEAD/DEAH box helicase [Candidatus Physcousia equi]